MGILVRMRRDAAPEGSLLGLLRRGRRRAVLRGLLAGSFLAALLNEAVRWGTVGLALALRRKMPILDAGPFFLAILPFFLLRHWDLPTVALRIDARLELRERLTSFLDFRGRADVPDELRRAQAAETARALAGPDVDAALPLRPWLAAGPVLLALSLLYPLLLPTGPNTPLVRLARRVIPGVALRPGGPVPDDAGPPTAERAAQKQSAALQRRPNGAAGKDVAGRGPEPAADAKARAQSGLAEGNPALEPKGGARKKPTPPRQPPRGEAREPEHIASERVGQSLARVVDPLYTAGKGSQPPAPRLSGTFSFHILPKPARGGAGAGAGGGSTESTVPERVTLDLDTIPERYRPVVRTYFELLAQGRAGGDARTAPDKETTP